MAVTTTVTRSNPFIDFSLGLCFTVIVLCLYIWGSVQRLVRLTAVSLNSSGLSNEQYEALSVLADYDLTTRQHQDIFPDPYEYDRCVLYQHEIAMLERCRDAKVPFELILRFAPSYAYNTIIPRTA